MNTVFIYDRFWGVDSNPVMKRSLTAIHTRLPRVPDTKVQFQRTQDKLVGSRITLAAEMRGSHGGHEEINACRRVYKKPSVFKMNS